MGRLPCCAASPEIPGKVGYGLRENLAGDDVPAFRAVNSKGELSGAYHFHISDLQKTLLEEDGIEVLWNGQCWCVDLKEYGWETTEEDVINFQNQFEAASEEA